MNELNIKFFLANAVLFGSIVLGLEITGYLEAIRLSGMVLPCVSSICGLLESDPLNAHPAIKVSTFGFASFVLLVVLALGSARGSRRAHTGLKVASSLFFAVGLALTIYTHVRYSGICPWCLVAASAYGVAALSALNTDLAECKSIVTWVVALPAATLCFAALWSVQHEFSAEPQHVSLLKADEVSEPWNQLETSQPKYVVVADFSCNACKRLLRKLQSGKVPFAVRILPPKTSYDRLAAELFYRAASYEDRRYVLRELVEETTLTTAALSRVERSMNSGSLGAIPELAFELDAAFSRRISVKGTPTLLVIDGGSVRLASVVEVSNAVRTSMLP